MTTDGHDAYPRAIREMLGEGVIHRCSQYMNNRIEQDHRGIKGRYQPMRGFGSFVSAARFCTAHDEVRDYFRHRTTMQEVVPLAGWTPSWPRRPPHSRWNLLPTRGDPVLRWSQS